MVSSVDEMPAVFVIPAVLGGILILSGKQEVKR
jgi:hypothetical protein